MTLAQRRVTNVIRSGKREFEFLSESTSKKVLSIVASSHLVYISGVRLCSIVSTVDSIFVSGALCVIFFYSSIVKAENKRSIPGTGIFIDTLTKPPAQLRCCGDRLALFAGVKVCKLRPSRGGQPSQRRPRSRYITRHHHEPPDKKPTKPCSRLCCLTS